MKAFTLMEILIALGILAVLSSFAIVAFSNFNKNALLKEARIKIISEMDYSRSQTLGSEGKSSWGVHFEADRIIRFKGTSFSPSDPNNVEILLPRGVAINSINLGGPSEVVFERLTGRASNAGSINIELNDSSASTTINIYASGITE